MLPSFDAVIRVNGGKKASSPAQVFHMQIPAACPLTAARTAFNYRRVLNVPCVIEVRAIDHRGAATGALHTFATRARTGHRTVSACA